MLQVHMIQKTDKKCANKKRLAGNCKGVLSGADEFSDYLINPLYFNTLQKSLLEVVANNASYCKGNNIH